jgi:hypothetical protein
VKYILRELHMQAALGNVDAAKKKKKKRRKMEKNEDENKNLKGTKKNQLSPMSLSAFRITTGLQYQQGAEVTYCAGYHVGSKHD